MCSPATLRENTLALTVAVLITISSIAPPAVADPITYDDFNDGNADGWWLGFSLAAPWNYGY